MSDAPSAAASPPTYQPPTQIVSGGNNKAMSSALAGSVMTIVAWVVRVYLKIDIPPEVEVAMVGLITTLAVYAIPHSNSSGAAN